MGENLISQNPIQRFKQGIQKFQNGGQPKEESITQNGVIAYRRIRLPFSGKYQWQQYDSSTRGYKPIKEEILVNGYYLKPDGTKVHRSVRQQNQIKPVIQNKPVDGDFGPKSEAALTAAEQAGYTVNRKNGTISIKANSNKKSNGLANMYEMIHAAQTGGNNLSNIEPINPKAITWVNPVRTVFDPHYSSNIPFLTALQDLTVSTINNGYRKLTGKGPESFLVQNPDIYDIPDDQKQILIKFYQDKKEKTGKEPTSFKASDWKELRGTYTGGNRNLLERAFMPSPEGALEHSLGQWNYYKDAEGNIHAIDTYDWNDGETSANQGSYTKARDFMGRFGTKASETKAQKENSGKYVARTMDINLGKI